MCLVVCSASYFVFGVDSAEEDEDEDAMLLSESEELLSDDLGVEDESSVGSQSDVELEDDEEEEDEKEGKAEGHARITSDSEGDDESFKSAESSVLSQDLETEPLKKGRKQLPKTNHVTPPKSTSKQNGKKVKGKVIDDDSGPESMDEDA
jgi:hypothetical protein